MNTGYTVVMAAGCWLVSLLLLVTHTTAQDSIAMVGSSNSLHAFIVILILDLYCPGERHAGPAGAERAAGPGRGAVRSAAAGGRGACCLCRQHLTRQALSKTCMLIMHVSSCRVVTASSCAHPSFQQTFLYYFGLTDLQSHDNEIL